MGKDVFREDAFQHLLQDKVPLLKKVLSHHRDPASLYKLIEGLHPREIAYLIQYLEAPYRESFVIWLKPHFNPEVFLFLAQNLRADVMSLLSSPEVVQILMALESDRALSLLSSLEEEQQEAVLEAMPEKERILFSTRLAYAEDSAGRLMQMEVLTLSQDWSIAQSLKHIRELKVFPSHIQDAFVVDEYHHPIGILPLSRLLREKEGLIKDFMDLEVHSIPVQWDQEEVAFMFRLYTLISAPVVNEMNELLGMITLDKVMDVIERKAAEDLFHMGRIHSSDFYASIFKTSFSRIHWLIITLFNTLLTSVVINAFQETLQEKVALTVLMPIAAAMGGNTGIQSATVIIRALATRELSMVNAGKTLLKEGRVALLNGTIFGILLGIIVYFWFNDIHFSMILGGAVVFNMLWAGLAGTFLPIMIARFRCDPALSAGPLLTTTTDVLGYVLFLGLAKWLTL